MKRGQFSQEQIVAILHQAERGEQTIQAICREHSITEVTFYRWRKAYGGMTVSEASRLKELERRTPASSVCWPSATWRWMPCRSTCKKSSRQNRARALLAHLQQRGLSERAACAYLGVNRATARYRPRPDNNADLLATLVAYAQKRRRRGYRKAHNALRRNGQRSASTGCIGCGSALCCR